MSPMVKKKKEKFTLPGKYLLFIFTIVCLLLMLLSYNIAAFDVPFNAVVGYVVVPFEKGISKLGLWISERTDEFSTVQELLEENATLQQKVEELTQENTLLSQEKYELTELRKLLELSDSYSEYHKVGARIIAKDSGNWYSSFVIDKGSDDGLLVDMNVIAGGGLVGRISSVGPNWARVTSIISDRTYVSGQILATGQTLMTEGSLELMNDGIISFSQLKDPDGLVREGDKVVTSQISDKFLPNLLIGYITEVKNDNNNLTKSGTLAPVVDFTDLSEVLVITDQKVTGYE